MGDLLCDGVECGRMSDSVELRDDETEDFRQGDELRLWHLLHLDAANVAYNMMDGHCWARVWRVQQARRCVGRMSRLESDWRAKVGRVGASRA